MESSHDSGRPAAAQVAMELVACSLCNETGFEAVYRDCPDRLHGCPGSFQVVRCRSCGLVQTNPRPNRASISHFYPDSYVPFAEGERQRGWFGRAIKQALQLPYRLRYGPIIMPNPESNDRNHLLDIGCGSGMLLNQMSELGWEVWGIEPDPIVGKAIERRLNVPVERIAIGTAEEIDFPNSSFDLIIMSHVLEHLHDPGFVLHKVGRWLRPSGRLRIWLPNVRSLESRIFGHLWFGLEVPRHLHHFDPVTLHRVLADAGFLVERMIPQFQLRTLGGSLGLLIDQILRRPGLASQSRPLSCAAMPIASLLLGFGNDACLDITATKIPS